MISTPLIIDPDKDLSGPCCPPAPGVKELHRIHRTLPKRTLLNNDEEVLQDESGRPILDEITGNYIYDNLKA